MHAGLPQDDYHNVMFNSCTKIVHRQLWDRVAGGPNRGDVQHASTGRTFWRDYLNCLEGQLRDKEV